MSKDAQWAIVGMILGHLIWLAIEHVRHVMWMRKFDREHGEANGRS